MCVSLVEAFIENYVEFNLSMCLNFGFIKKKKSQSLKLGKKIMRWNIKMLVEQLAFNL